MDMRAIPCCFRRTVHAGGNRWHSQTLEVADILLGEVLYGLVSQDNADALAALANIADVISEYACHHRHDAQRCDAVEVLTDRMQDALTIGEMYATWHTVPHRSHLSAVESITISISFIERYVLKEVRS